MKEEDAGEVQLEELQECRRMTQNFWTQVVSGNCIVLQDHTSVELPGAGFNGSITGVGVWFPGVIV